MKKINLQLFGEAVSGKKVVYLFRVKDMANSKDGATLAYTTENSRTTSKEADSTATKDGSIRTPGVAEVEISATCYMSKEDKLIDELEKAMDEDKLIEIWEAYLERPIASQTNKFEGKYYQGYLTEVELSSSSDDFAEFSLTFGINGAGVSAGQTGITVTAEQQAEADYVFTDATKNSGM